MRLKEIYSQNTQISFEIFPVEDKKRLLSELDILKQYSPAFISLTCGAGGSENASFELIDSIISKKINVMPHLTCITSSKKNIKEKLLKITKKGTENILALRGDIPEDYDINSGDFKYANELVEFIKSETALSIGVAGYPEGHIESPDINTDMKFLKNKINFGAEVIFTQLFFDNTKFYDFVERAKKCSISVPIIPGIMPITSKKQIDKMTKLAKITIPKNLRDAIEKYDEKSLTEYGIDYSSKQCEELLKFGVSGLHFFTLNKSYSTSKILDNIRR